ncbi:MAG TPA: thiol:disulfide interchange protein DsbA/DsbL [Gammaproteobacteria bacterium]|nr:thiol:disulfide interchange protein DsbA/DsbL [Gammaproteobacteria bacterium]
MKSLIVSAFAFLLASGTTVANAQSGEPVAGKDYIEIPNGTPPDPSSKQVVVEEFFNYICPACFGFEPLLLSWTSKLPEYAKLVHVPATFRPDFMQYARAYYAAEALGVADKTHAAVYEAIHVTHKIPAEGDKPDEEKIAAFYAGFGVDKAQFLSTMKSFGVETKLKRATERMQRSRVSGTPSLVVNGRYLVRGQSTQDMLRIASYLIEKEHNKK